MTRAGCRRTASSSPLRGEKSDGHNFVEQAIEKGAVASSWRSSGDAASARHLLVVENSRRALADLAAAFTEIRRAD